MVGRHALVSLVDGVCNGDGHRLPRGVSSAVFALAFCFAGVTMYDAAGVRRSTGRNAAVINHIVEGLSGKGFNFDDEHLKELVGHTPIQVLAGALLGILIGVLMA